MTSYPCNNYEQITPSYRLSVKYINIDKGDTHGVILLDIKKPFDTIDHNI